MEASDHPLPPPLEDVVLEDVPIWEAELLHIYISPGHDYWGKQGEGRLQHGVQQVNQAECVAGRGLRGDRYFERRTGHKGQVTFFDAQVVDEIRSRFRLAKLPASVFRRNLIIRGPRLQDWLGKRFLFQGIVFEGAQECQPCHWMDRAVAEGAEDFLASDFRGGLRAKVITPGILRVSETLPD